MESLGGETRKTCILGVGNELRCDDGIGPLVLNRLRQKSWSAPLDLFTVGRDVFSILEYIGVYNKIIIIDALPPDQKPGKIRIIHWNSYRAVASDTLSLHDVDLITILNMAHWRAHTSITLLGIETCSLQWHIGLSPELQRMLNDIVERVYLFISRNQSS